MGIKSIHFDLDGVLVDAKEWHIESLHRALRDFGICIDMNYQEKLCGLPTALKLKRISEEVQPIPQERFSLISELKQEYTYQFFDKYLVPNTQLITVFRRLRHSSIATALCSNSRRETIDLAVARLGLGDFLSHTISAADVSEPKPSPEIYCQSFAALGHHSSQCAIVEDSPFGIAAAQAASPGKLIVVTQSADVTEDRIFSEIGHAPAIFEKLSA